VKRIELYHYPPNRFSAEFLGRANILQATALTDSPEPGLVSVSCGGGLINAFSRAASMATISCCAFARSI
jgi:2-aminoethylphosphonate transport system ATP-binding protein